MVGIRDKELSRRLQLKTDLTLDTAVLTVRQAKDIAQQVSQQEEGASSSVQEVTHRRPENKKTWDERRSARERNKG